MAPRFLDHRRFRLLTELHGQLIVVNLGDKEIADLVSYAHLGFQVVY